MREAATSAAGGDQAGRKNSKTRKPDVQPRISRSVPGRAGRLAGEAGRSPGIGRTSALCGFGLGLRSLRDEAASAGGVMAQAVPRARSRAARAERRGMAPSWLAGGGRPVCQKDDAVWRAPTSDPRVSQAYLCMEVSHPWCTARDSFTDPPRKPCVWAKMSSLLNSSPISEIDVSWPYHCLSCPGPQLPRMCRGAEAPAGSSPSSRSEPDPCSPSPDELEGPPRQTPGGSASRRFGRQAASL